MQRLLGYLLGFLIASSAIAETYKLTDGRTIIGDPVGITSKGLVLKLSDGSYSSSTPWDQITQDSLKELRKNPKAAQFVEAYIVLTEEEREKLSGLTLVDVPRIDRPTGNTGIVGMLFSTGVGWFLILLIYLGNLFAAYEVALYRAYSPQIVCGIAAVLPWIGSVVLLAVPRQVLVGITGGRSSAGSPVAEEIEEIGEQEPSPEEILPPGEMFEEEPVPEEAAQPLLPETITYSRGVITFNRRFFETKFAKFTKLQKPEDVADLVLLFKTSRGEHQSTYISKLEQTQLTIQVSKGDASDDVTVPYLEVYEVQVKHKDLL